MQVKPPILIAVVFYSMLGVVVQGCLGCSKPSPKPASSPTVVVDGVAPEAWSKGKTAPDVDCSKGDCVAWGEPSGEIGTCEFCSTDGRPCKEAPCPAPKLLRKSRVAPAKVEYRCVDGWIQGTPCVEDQITAPWEREWKVAVIREGTGECIPYGKDGDRCAGFRMAPGEPCRMMVDGGTTETMGPITPAQEAEIQRKAKEYASAEYCDLPKPIKAVPGIAQHPIHFHEDHTGYPPGDPRGRWPEPATTLAETAPLTSSTTFLPARGSGLSGMGAALLQGDDPHECRGDRGFGHWNETQQSCEVTVRFADSMGPLVCSTEVIDRTVTCWYKPTP